MIGKQVKNYCYQINFHHIFCIRHCNMFLIALVEFISQEFEIFYLLIILKKTQTMF